ncbi:phospholipase A1-like isoform X2 [Planococcus citri]
MIIKFIKLTAILMILMSLQNGTSVAKILPRKPRDFLTPVKYAAKAIWNTVKMDKMEVSLTIIYRKNSKQEEVHLSLSSNQSVSGLPRSIFKKEIVFITHGFLSDGDEFWVKDMAEAYLARKNVVIVTVNWGAGALITIYSKAVKNMIKVAKMLVDFITNLIEHHRVKASRIHLIGFSLGAHLFGIVGKGIPGIHRITGLDPARKYFENNTEHRLSKNDARYVDVVHTNTIDHGFGLPDSVGHVDFYINGGKIQRGCRSFVKSLDILYRYACSHGKSVEYFIESIKNIDCVFVGFREMNNSRYTTAHLGLDTFKQKNTVGDYYIVTNAQSPYCMKW